MTTVMSATSSSPVTSPAAQVVSPSSSSTSSNPNHPTLPPLITSPPGPAPAPPRRTTLPRPMSHASKSRLSQYSTTGSIPSRSRPPSHVFPIYPSSLPYTLVRDFAYAPNHPLHYGPPPEPSRPLSGMTTPASEFDRRLSDPPQAWETTTKLGWESWQPEAFGKAPELAPISFSDGPPWSEDEDLQSPVVSSRHKKHKSTSATYSGRHQHKGPREERSASQGSATILNPENYDRERGYYAGTTGDGGERYYVSHGGEANGPGGEYVTYPPDQARHSTAAATTFPMAEQQPRQYAAESDSESSGKSSPGLQDYDESRYSRDYQFTITSPDEEMHGKAVALYDFARENENELPLVEGQVIWVSYRHGQGWLVAEDPKTQESGLVPEEYVRLLRDIEGGISSLTGQVEATAASPNDGGTPTQAEHNTTFTHTPTASNASNGYHQPVLSTFSTSSKDLELYPQHMLGGQAAHRPPQVVHYHGQRGGSQANTPTLQFHHDAGTFIRRGSQDAASGKSRDSGSAKSQTLETLPDSKMESPAAEEKKGELPKPESRAVGMIDR
ncbi:uncharacterized protein MKZ38_001788 [Zalerion maritima]|uniref:SH3 domain-containing protein n=1 Tax=Zalerion maritima TaxID=339359 RepID=A0AAD5RZI9_9PEZI|nr:uncharacterized protein MKZ38_001788 [Zalerion maritima]